MECQNARHLIPSYLDGELSEAQAGPLRKHLLDCQPCRGSTQSAKNLKRWFVDPEPVAVPRDFSSRVARRAFAGDTGERHIASVASATSSAAPDRHLRFVLQMTAVAAAILIFLSIALSRIHLPSESRLMADDQPEANLERALEELDHLDASAAGAGASGAQHGPAAQRESDAERARHSTSPSEAHKP